MTPAVLTVSSAAAALVLALARTASASAQDIAAKAVLCDACHGEKGIPSDSTMPVIWGQHQAYLARQIGEFKLGTRTNEPMLALICDMPDAELRLSQSTSRRNRGPSSTSRTPPRPSRSEPRPPLSLDNAWRVTASWAEATA